LRRGVRRPPAEAEKLTLARAVTVCVLLLLFTATSARAVDPGRRISQYAHTAWRIQDGVFTGAPNAITQTADGNLWVATTEGIDCFRNTRVVSFSTREGLGANEVNSVLAARDGRIWFGNHNALESLQAGKALSLREKDGLPGKSVTSLLEDHAGRLWVGVDNGLSVYEAGKLRPVRRSDGSPVGVVIAMAEDRDHNIWAEAIGSPGRLIRIQDFTVREEIPAPRVPVAISLAADPQEGVWLGLVNGDLARYRQGGLKDGHFGLQGMRERAARIGGRLSLVSSPNSGTEVALVVPGSVVYRRASVAPSEWIKAAFRR
jgi:ligand-binding sensor domain-containing protein